MRVCALKGVCMMRVGLLIAALLYSGVSSLNTKRILSCNLAVPYQEVNMWMSGAGSFVKFNWPWENKRKGSRHVTDNAATRGGGRLTAEQRIVEMLTDGS